MEDKTMNLQLFAEETTEEVVEVAEQPTETVETEAPVETTEEVSYRDLDYKYKDEKGKLSDYAPDEVVKNFQLGKKYLEHESDITFTKKLKEMYGVKDTAALEEMFNKAAEDNIRSSAPDGIPEDQLDQWVQFQKAQQLEQAKAPERELEAKMTEQVEELKSSGRIKAVTDIPDGVFDIYKARGNRDLEGAFDAYELQQTKIKLKESENAASSPGSLKGSPVVPTQKAYGPSMTNAEKEAYKEQRRAIARSQKR